MPLNDAAALSVVDLVVVISRGEYQNMKASIMMWLKIVSLMASKLLIILIAFIKC